MTNIKVFQEESQWMIDNGAIIRTATPEEVELFFAYKNNSSSLSVKEATLVCSNLTFCYEQMELARGYLNVRAFPNLKAASDSLANMFSFIAGVFKVPIANGSRKTYREPTMTDIINQEIAKAHSQENQPEQQDNVQSAAVSQILEQQPIVEEGEFQERYKSDW